MNTGEGLTVQHLRLKAYREINDRGSKAKNIDRKRKGGKISAKQALID